MGDAAMRSHREAMVDRQLVARGISDERVLAAMREIPRHLKADSVWPTATARSPSAAARPSASRTSSPS